MIGYTGWHPHGGFSTKSAIEIIKNDDDREPNRMWEIVWRVLVSQQIRTFPWPFLYDKVLTNTTDF